MVSKPLPSLPGTIWVTVTGFAGTETVTTGRGTDIVTAGLGTETVTGTITGLGTVTATGRGLMLYTVLGCVGIT